jgi:hypothetical protein
VGAPSNYQLLVEKNRLIRVPENRVQPSATHTKEIQTKAIRLTSAAALTEKTKRLRMRRRKHNSRSDHVNDTNGTLLRGARKHRLLSGGEGVRRLNFNPFQQRGVVDGHVANLGGRGPANEKVIPHLTKEGVGGLIVDPELSGVILSKRRDLVG